MGKQGFCFSPSNMDTYRTCPRKFQAQSLTKEIKWKASTQKSRGSLIHGSLDKAVKSGIQAVSAWPEGVDAGYVTQQVTDARQMIAGGAQVFIEHEMTVNDKFRAVGWWDDDAMLRAKADMVLLPPGMEPIEIYDFKSGKIWDNDHFQLRVECLLAHLIYQRPVVNYAYWYVDVGETRDGSIDFRNGLTPVQDVINLMKEMKLAMRDNYFPPEKNNLCKWRTGQCDLYGKCGA